MSRRTGPEKWNLDRAALNLFARGVSN